jgi:hypothetical protein
MPLLVVVVMFQVILTGGIFPLAGKTGIEQIAWASPSRWGFAATASTANLNVIQEPPGQAAAAKSPASTKTAGTTGKASTSHTAKGSKATKASKAKARAHHSTAPARSASPTATASTAATGVPSLPTDPIWAHKSAIWVKDISYMVLLGLLFTLLAWWRVIRIKPGRRR